MRKTRSILAVLTALVLALALCACGGSASAPAAPADKVESETAKPAESTPAKTESTPAETESAVAEVLPIEGDYSIFAVQYSGYLIYADSMGVESTMQLTEDGKGSMSINDETMDISSWEAHDDSIDFTLADESAATAVVKNGVLELDLYGDASMILFYAQEKADLSAYSPMTTEEVQAAIEADVPDSKLYAFSQGLDAAAGVHLDYDLHTDYLDADQHYDVHGKGPLYYSSRTTKAADKERTLVTVFRDNTAYNLDPEKKTGIIATTTTATSITDNILLMDNLYSDIHTYSSFSDYTTETREWNGISCTVEVFPAGDYTPEAAFYFDDSGKLVYVAKGAPVIETTVEIGETLYTVNTIDDAVDESLFDISGYTIS